MEKFLEAARIAWHPVGAVRKRSSDGTLSFSSVLVQYIGIVIICNLFAGGAQRFFFESLLSQLGGQLPDIPILKNDWAQKFMSAIGVLIPVGAISLLPTRVFYPSARNSTAASLLVVGAAWAFYGALLSAPLYFLSGLMASVDPKLGLTTYVYLSFPVSLAIMVLVGGFWFRITLSVLGIRFSRVLLISSVGLLAIATLFGLVMLAMSKMTF
jgi:hypothetical protein